MTGLGLEAVVNTSTTVSSTKSRKAKVTAVAELLQACPAEDTALAVALLAATPRQGKIGIGWATLGEVDVEPAPGPTLSLRDVDAAFDALASTRGTGSTGRRRELLEELLRRATPEEAEFIQRVIIGELRQGANESLVLDGLAKARQIPISALRRALMLSGDVLLVAAVAADAGQDGIALIALEVGRPLRPMLASTASDVPEAMEASKSAAVEWKLDGARIQVHRNGHDVRIWTRNLNEITERLPSVAAAVRSLDADALVLDGEVLGFSEDETPDAFQNTMSSFSAESGPAHGLRSLFFDILHRDGRDLVDEPLVERRAHLLEVCGDLAIPGAITSDTAVAESVMESALDAGHEGVMVKDSAATYEAGRRGKAWRKVKPVHTFDLIVLAAEWGHGRRTGWLSNLHLGALDDDGQFVMVGKTFKGLTDSMLEWQTQELLERQTRESGITVFVRPELVVEIALDGVQASTRYPGGVALRFARVRSYRSDKSPDQVDALRSLQQMLHRNG